MSDRINFTPAEASTFRAGVRSQSGLTSPDRSFGTPIEMAQAGIGVSTEFIAKRWGAEAAIQYSTAMAERTKNQRIAKAREQYMQKPIDPYFDPMMGNGERGSQRYPGFGR